MTRPVDVVAHDGPVAALHALDPLGGAPPEHPVIWHHRYADAAIVLGSRQTAALVDAERCRAAGLAVVRRRSGGGAVLLRPGAMTWLDVVLPRGVAPDDVRGSMVWIGRLWHDVLLGLGADEAALRVHDGGMVETAWSELVCFAGVGPGEIVVGGRKLVGLSQRRTRHGTRVQCLVHRAAAIDEMRELFAVDTPPQPLERPATLADVGAAGRADDAIAERLAAALSSRLG